VGSEAYLEVNRTQRCKKLNAKAQLALSEHNGAEELSA
jgi:hypothetical protein